MKRGYIRLSVLAVIGIFFVVYGVNAIEMINCSSSEQRLFRISSLQNAHGEQWNASGGYPYEICFYDYFSGVYPSWGNPHLCDGTNTVLRLSGITDAHAEGPAGSTSEYTDVCFGNLECFLQTGGKSCDEAPGSSGYCMITTLSGNTNAHLAITKHYDYSICCKPRSEFICRCNYNGICEYEERGETPANCPDCVTVCGDGVIEIGEECDGTNLSGRDCTTFRPDSPFAGGTLGCFPPEHPNECRFNSAGCVFAQCSNTMDDDGDGLTDSLDPGCWTDQTNPSTYNPGDNNESDGTSQCQDGRDNDGDGDIDYGEDLDCDSPQDNSESACGNGRLERLAGEECDCSGGECDFGGETCVTAGDYISGTLNCTSSCTYNFDGCIGSGGFCNDNEPFEFQEGEYWLAPSSCQDYNKVYPLNPSVGDVKNHSMRRELCMKDCVPGASDPVNNGYGGETLSGWGCAFDENEGDGIENNGECYFYFNSASDSTRTCRSDYTVLEDCGPSSPFRKVRVEPKTIPPGETWTCDVGCGDGQPCETQIKCPTVIELPAIGTVGLVLAAILITLIYAIMRKK